MGGQPSASSAKIHDEESQSLIPALPNEVALQCIARVPRFHLPCLSLVCKSWHASLRSPIYHSTRIALNTSQSLIFFNLGLFNPIEESVSLKWCYLDPYTSRTLIPIGPSPFQPEEGASFVSLGHHLYVIGGSVNELPSSEMWVFDCLANKWEKGPNMRIEREFAASGVIDGKIYVLGGCVLDSSASSNWAEVFDPVTGSWNAVPNPIEPEEMWLYASPVVGGRLYAIYDRGGVIFDPVLGEWGQVSMELSKEWGLGKGAALVDGVLYCFDYAGKIRGFDFEKNDWKELKAVDYSFPKFLAGASMTCVGGRLFVMWEGKGKWIRKWKGLLNKNWKETVMLCAEISVSKDKSGELWGSIVWSDMIIIFPEGSIVVHCLEVHL